MIIQIDGWHGAGKGVLWSLLDGHKDIFVVPIHEASYFPLLVSNNDEYWLRKKDIVELRKKLSIEGYYYFEKFYNQSHYYLYFSAANTMNIDYKVDFYKFDNLFISRAVAMKEWTVENLIKLLYTTYYELYTDNLICPRYIASMGVPRKRDFEQELKVYPNTKCIVIKRELKNIIATNINRIDQENQILSCSLNDILRYQVSSIIDYYQQFEYVAKKYPNNFYIVDFKDLIDNTTKQMQKIAKFLDIEFNDILTIPTRDGILLEQNGESFIGKENDIAENLLSQEELKLIDIVLNEKLLFNTNLAKNIPIAHNVSKIFKEIHRLKHEYNKIIVYGNGYLGQTIAPFLEQKLVGIVDKYKYSKSSDKDYKIISIDDLNKIDYDIIVITVLGREYEIVSELINMGIGMNKILVL